MANDPTKCCKQCGVEKSLTEFHRHSMTSDGRQTLCKICKSALSKKIYRANLDYEHERRHTYYQAHREREAARNRMRYARNKEHCLMVAEAWRKRHRDVVRAAARARHAKNPVGYKNSQLRKYGLDLCGYTQLYKSQKGQCKICNRVLPPLNRQGLWVDHCHATGKVRGLLCRKCNTGLGLFDDNPEIMFKAAEYVSKYKEMTQLLSA